MTDSKLAKTLASLTPEKRELLLKKLNEKKLAEGRGGVKVTIPPVPRGQSGYDLSYSQQRIWFLNQLDAQSASYNISVAIKMVGGLNVECLRRSFEFLAGRHESFRTSFVNAQGSAQQIIHPNTAWKLPAEDLSDLSEESRQSEVELAAQTDAQVPFDLAVPPLMRTRLIKTQVTEHILLVSMHHIISDGLSASILIAELEHCYQQFITDSTPDLPALPIQYVDFTAWQRQWMKSDSCKQQLNYWKAQLANVETLEMPIDFPRGAIQGENGATFPIALNDKLSKDVIAFSRGREATLFMSLLAAFMVLLHRYSRQSDVCVGSPIANRNHTEVEGLVGCFINTLALRGNLSADPSFLDFLEQIQKTTLDAYTHQDVPFDALLDELGIARSTTHTPVFQVMFNLTNISKQRGLQLGELDSEFLPLESHTAKFELSLNLNEEDGLISGWFEYNTDLYSTATIERMQGHYEKLLESIVAAAELPISQLNFLGEEEKLQVLVNWNQTLRDYQRDSSVVELFERQVEVRGDSPALQWSCSTSDPNAPDIINPGVHQSNYQQVSYRELNKQANKIANALLARGVGSAMRVGLCCNRSLELIAAVLGVLKTGAAYVPLDPNYPMASLKHMLKDTEVSCVLVQDSLKDNLPRGAFDALSIEILLQTESNEGNPNITISATDPIYYIYTSGSTGLPKGVETIHRNVVRLVDNTDFIELDENTVFLMMAPISFDASTLEIWAPLLNGGLLVLAPLDANDPVRLEQALNTCSINCLWLTAALFHYIAEYHPGIFGSLRYLLTGGDVVSADHARSVLAANPDLILVDGYGPTENTTFTACAVMTDAEQIGDSVPIGKPIANTQVYILDQYRQPVPVGVPGELYCGGDGLANGYLKRPDLNRDAFITHQFDLPSGKMHADLYKTGDLVRWTGDGDIEFLGRIDQQVKIRGYRIEIGEIESNLKTLDSIREVAVVAREDKPGSKKLVGYVVASHDVVLGVVELKQRLKSKMPDYMIPSTFVQLDELPVTAVGKLDRNALPAPSFESDESHNYVAPTTHAEKVLSQIWTAVLNVEPISIHDNFFELGGDSILSIQIVSRAQQDGLAINAKALFENQTIAELAAASGNNASVVIAQQTVVEGSVPLTPIQNWFFDQQLVHPEHFNQAFLFDLTPVTQYSDLEAVFSALVVHHDALRLRFKRKSQSQWVQYHEKPEQCLASTTIDFEEAEFASTDAQALSGYYDALQGSLNLTQGPLFKALVTKFSDGQSRLLILAHHLIVDGVSWRILLADIERGLTFLDEGRAIDFGVKSTAFKQWSEALKIYSELPASVDNASSWLPSFEGLQSTYDLETDYIGGDNRVGKEVEIQSALDVNYTDKLLKSANIAFGTSAPDLLICALYETLADFSKEKQVLIGLEGHGREDIDMAVDGCIDVSRTVGWFTSMFPVMLSHFGGDWVSRLKSIKQQVRSIPKKGFDFGIQKHLSSDRKLSTKLRNIDMPDLVFNYHGQIDGASTSNKYMVLAKDSAGRLNALGNERANLIDLVAHVEKGQLRVSWCYSSDLFASDTLEGLADRYVENLERLLDRCTSQKTVSYTPSDFPLVSLAQAELDEIADMQSNLAAEIETVIPLSPMQQGMLFHSLYDEGSGVYFEQILIEIEQTLDQSCLSQAWHTLVQRHQSLRSCFYYDVCEEPVQVISKNSTCEINFLTHKNLSTSDSAEAIQTYLTDDRKRGLDFSRPGLARIAVFQRADGTTKVLFSFHHIIMDGWSLPIVIGELLQTYRQLLNGEELRVQSAGKYSDFLAYLASADRSAAQVYWQNRLIGLSAATPIPQMRSLSEQAAIRSASGSLGYRERIITLSTARTAQLQQLAREQRITLNTIVQVAWGLLLARYSNETDVIFGVTVSGRPPELLGIEHTVGLFINTIPLRMELSDKTTLLPFLQQIYKEQVDAQQHEFMPLVDIQHLSDISGDQPLFQSLVVFENFPIQDEVSKEGDDLGVVELESFEHTNYPLTVVVEPADQLGLKISYDESLFEELSVVSMLGHLNQVLVQVAEHKEEPLLQWPILEAVEYDKITKLWNDTVSDRPHTALGELFASVAEKYPSRLAVRCGDSSLSYSQLDAISSQLAHHLRAQNVEQRQVVGIALQRSMESVVISLAVAKIGAIYLALDTTYPDDRLRYLIEDSGVAVIYTDEFNYERLVNLVHSSPVKLSEVCDLYKSIEHLPTSLPKLERVDGEHQVACLFYTSGSTGRPKGVPIHHAGILSLAFNPQQFPLKPTDVVCHASNISFDASTFDVWPTLLHGACIAVFSKDVILSPEAFKKDLERCGVNKLFLATALFHVFAAQFPETFTNIDTLTVGGGLIDTNHIASAFQNSNLKKLVNGYGPTENSCFTTSYAFEEAPLASSSTPIGKPLANRTCYILDRYRQPVPVNVAGELWLGGDGVAREYWHQSERTSASFSPDWFSGKPGAQLYRSGDLARYLSDGNIEFLGRADDQIKLRGFRVELSEIENCIRNIAGVDDSVVIVIEGSAGNKLLAAYVTLSDVSLSEGDLIRELKAQLPPHMIPVTIALLDALPLTPNGKVDTRKLPPIEYLDEPSAADYVAPTTAFQKVMVEIWQQVLQRECVGIGDNFFELGGDSILTIQIISRAKRAGYTLSAKQVFDAQTISALCHTVKRNEGEVKSEQGLLEGPIELLPAQQWFFKRRLPHSNQFNMSLLFTLPHLSDACDVKKAVHALLCHHDALRAVFENEKASYSSIVDVESAWHEYNVSPGADLYAIFARVGETLQTSLSILTGPLIKVGFIQTESESNYLMLVVHHLVSDVISLRILVEDLLSALNQADQSEISLGVKGSSVRQWAAAISRQNENDQPTDETVNTQKAVSKESEQATVSVDEVSYWQAIIKQSKATVNVDKSAQNTEGHAVTGELTLTADQTTRLLTQASKAYKLEISDLLLSALSKTLNDWQSSDRILVDVEGHGRQEFDESLDVNRTVGWFTSIYPVVLDGSSDLQELILGVKKQLRAVPSKGLNFGPLLFAKNNPLKVNGDDVGREISFNYLGQLDNALAIVDGVELMQAAIGDECHSANPRAYLLDFIAHVTNGQLTLACRYSDDCFKQDIVDDLLSSMRENLLSVIEHCVTAKHRYDPSDFPLAMLSETQLNQLTNRVGSIEAIYPLSAVQQGMLFHALYEPNSWVYFDQVGFDLSGSVNPDLLRQAWKLVFKRHQIFRTSFLWDNVDRPYQVVAATVNLNFEVIDWRELSEHVALSRLDSFLIADRDEGFDFGQTGICRVTVVRLPNDRCRLVWSFHHTLLDGWSTPLVYSELMQIYEGLVNGKEVEFPLAPSYQSYIEYLCAQPEGAAEEFWINYLSGFSAPTALGFKRKLALDVGEVTEEHRYKEQEFCVASDLLEQLQALAKKQHLTVNHIFQGVWSLLLQRYSGEHDIVFGTTVSGRPAELPGIETMVGLFINTIPVRAQLDRDQPFIEWLQDFARSQRDLKSYESTALVDIQRYSEVSSKVVLFESILVFENYPVDAALEGYQELLDVRDIHAFQQTNFPLTLIIIPHNSELLVRASYDGVMFSESAISRVLGHILTLLQSVISAPQAAIKSLAYITAEEERKILYDWNLTARDFPVDAPLAEQFESWVSQTPDAVATDFGGKQLSYRELNQSSNRLANFLVAKGVGLQDRIALCFGRCEEMIVAIVALIKIGAVYVPIDPSIPTDRFRFMLEDTAATALLSSEQFSAECKALNLDDGTTEVELITVELIAAELATQPSDNLAPVVAERESAAEMLGYIIYTSGSTGKPKGVCAPYRGISRLVVNTNYMDVKPGDKFAHLSNVAFDAATFEIWGALLNGAAVVGIEQDAVLDSVAFGRVLAEKEIGVSLITTALFNLHASINPAMFAALDYLLVGGEALDVKAIRAVFEAGKPRRLFNAYGPTENTSLSMIHEVDAVDVGAASIPIGRPIANTTLYILDDDLKPVAVGVSGTMFLGGLGLATGYLNRDDLTRAAFVKHPFEENELLYNSGDLGYYREDGTVEIQGRIDDQVKLRGFRIELTEVQAAVSALDCVERAYVSVLMDKRGAKQIIAYCLFNGDSVAPSVLKAQLNNHLPHYMVPAAYVPLSEMPVNRNGKVDKKMLPPFDAFLVHAADYVAARTDIESTLISIWQEVLGLDKIGVLDDFFDLGGHSLIATQVHSRMRQEMGVEIPLKALFEVPTVGGLAELIRSIGLGDEPIDDADEDYEDGVL